MIRNVLKTLLKPEAYPEATTKVELIQTHVSWLFLTDSYVYKIKKPVDFGFLNFTTIDRRRFYCNEEVKYNRRLCPDLYLGVVELRQTASGATFCSSGQTIDYAVKMKRLPAERMLDQLVNADQVTTPEFEEIARVIAAFHLHAPTSPVISQYGFPDRILFNWNENFELAIPFENLTLPSSEREYIRKWVNLFLSRNSALFEKRVRDGNIRECDGDIHLENICLHNGTAYIFDCIEFSERFRCCDTVSDIAFLLMDIDFHDRRYLSDAVFSAYEAATGDTGISDLLGFYKIYRAFIRGKIESLHARDPGIDQSERTAAIQKAIQYFRLARGYIERDKLKTTLFITCGLMGSGKSSLADQLGFELGINVVKSDITRKLLANISPQTRASFPYGEGLYSPDKNELTYHTLHERAEKELAQGRSIIIDACFIHKHERLKFAALAKLFDANFVILYVSCSEAINKRRLHGRSSSGRTASDGRAELLNRQRLEFEIPEASEGCVIPIRSITPPATLTSTIYERIF